MNNADQDPVIKHEINDRPCMINRVRRVIRDEITCGKYLDLQSIRFDVQIARPDNLCERETDRHKSVVRRSLTYLLKSK